MDKFILICCLLLITTVVAVCGQPHSKGSTKESPQPSFAISFEQNNLEIGGAITATLQVTNTSGYNLSALQLRMDGPGFLEYADGNKRMNGATLLLDDIPAYTTLRTYRFQIKAPPSEGRVGDFNILFTLLYKWKDNKLLHQNQATLEKTLNVGLLGTDKLMGVPLAFADFVVPGLMFIFTLSFFKIPEVNNAGPDDKIIASIVISVLCLFLVSVFNGKIWHGLASVFDADNSMSMFKLFMLAFTGIISGVLTFGIYRFLGNLKRKKMENLLITGAESNRDLLEKILKLNPKYNGFPIEFTLKDGRKYIGAHYAEREYDYILIGAYQVNTQGSSEKIRNELKKHTYNNKRTDLIQDPRNLLAVLKMFQKENTDSIEIRYFVKEVIEKGENKDAGNFLPISKDDFNVKKSVPDEKKMKLLVLA